MGNWYDYVPVVGSVSRLASGDMKGALYHQFDPLNVGGYLKDAATGIGDYWDKLYNDKEDALQGAANKSRALGERMRQFQMEGLNRAEAYFGPAQQMTQAVYGTPDKMRK